MGIMISPYNIGAVQEIFPEGVTTIHTQNGDSIPVLRYRAGTIIYNRSTDGELITEIDDVPMVLEYLMNYVPEPNVEPGQIPSLDQLSQSRSIGLRTTDSISHNINLSVNYTMATVNDGTTLLKPDQFIITSTRITNQTEAGTRLRERTAEFSIIDHEEYGRLCILKKYKDSFTNQNSAMVTALYEPENQTTQMPPAYAEQYFEKMLADILEDWQYTENPQIS